MAVVVWDVAEFRTLYPQFDYPGGRMPCTDGQLAGLFEMACALVDNSETSTIPYEPDRGVTIRKVLLYAIVCHLATLAWQGRQGQFGTISNATEGSVSVGFQQPTLPASGVTQAWYGQTPCGLLAWSLLRRYALGGVGYKPPKYHPWG